MHPSAAAPPEESIMTMQPLDPQQPQVAPQVQPVGSRPPVWPKVVGIIAIVLAGMGIIGAPLLSVFNHYNPMTRDLMEHFPEWHQTYEIVYGVGAGLLLLIAGVLLLKRQPLAAPLFILWAVLALASTVLDIFTLMEVLESMGSDAPDAERLGVRMGMMAAIPMGLAIPGFTLYWFCRAKTRQDLADLSAAA